MHIHKDFKEFLESLNAAQVDFVVIGAHALAYHGKPRWTSDLDLFVRVSPENARRIEEAFRIFGFGGLHTAKDFLEPDQFVQIGVEPVRIDVSTGISGVTFDEVWESKEASDIVGVPVFFISKDMYIKNKVASGRPQDKFDLALLGVNSQAPRE